MSNQSETLESLAARMPGVPRAAIAEAIETLVAAGVLTPEPEVDGQRRYRYTNPERYKLIDVPVVKQPGPEFGRR
jgi:hypothetical protein